MMKKILYGVTGLLLLAALAFSILYGMERIRFSNGGVEIEFSATRAPVATPMLPQIPKNTGKINTPQPTQAQTSKPIQILATTQTPQPTAEPLPAAPAEARSATNGRLLEGDKQQTQPVMVCMGNGASARPQVGLNEADLIYEAPAEYAATQLYCLYSQNIPAFCGPVRASRQYFTDLGRQWGALSVEKGYAGFVIAGEEREQEPDMGKLLWPLSTGEKKAQTMMISLPEWVEVCGGRQAANPEAGLAFDPEAGREGTPFSEVILNFFYPSSKEEEERIRFAYEPEEDCLIRYQDGKRFKTKTPLSGISANSARLERAEFTTQNLVVQYVTCATVGEEDTYRYLDLTGEGLCDYFIHGRHSTGKWVREGEEAFTKYYLDNGELLKLVPGRSWICLHPNDFEKSPVIIRYGDGSSLVRESNELTQGDMDASMTEFMGLDLRLVKGGD